MPCQPSSSFGEARKREGARFLGPIRQRFSAPSLPGRLPYRRFACACLVREVACWAREGRDSCSRRRWVLCFASEVVYRRDDVRHLYGLWISLLFASGASANTLEASNVLSNVIVFQDESGPNGCGHRSLAGVDHGDGTMSVGDVQVIMSWSDDHSSFYGMLKARTTRHKLEGGELKQTATARLERVSISKNDFSQVAIPADLQASNEEGFYFGAVPADKLNEIVADGMDSPALLFNFKDADRPGQESIRFRVNLSDNDKQSLAGCMLALTNRARPFIRPQQE